MDQVGQDEGKARLAAATLLLLPGTPFLYYGEEIGMSGAAYLTGDWKIRTPMSWTGDATAGFTSGMPFRALSANRATHNVAAEDGVPGSLLEWYRALVALRRSVPALAAGGLEAAAAPGGTALAFQRSQGTGHAQVVLNFAAADAAITLAGLPPGATLAGRFPAGTGDATVAADGTLTVTVPPRSPLVYTWTR
jgi:glycosidase